MTLGRSDGQRDNAEGEADAYYKEHRQRRSDRRVWPTPRARTATGLGAGAVLLVDDIAGKLGAGADAELPVDVTEVVLDRLGAENQLCARLAICRSPRHGARDLQLLRRQAVTEIDVATAHRLAGRAELLLGAGRPRHRLELRESVQRRAEVLARLHATPGSSKALAEDQRRARPAERHPRIVVRRQGVGKAVFRLGPVRHQTPTTLQKTADRRAASVGGRDRRERVSWNVSVRPYTRLDVVGERSRAVIPSAASNWIIASSGRPRLKSRSPRASETFRGGSTPRRTAIASDSAAWLR